MGIKFKQIDNLQNTFDGLSGSFDARITSNTNDISGIYNDPQTLSGWKYFNNNVDVSGAQGLLVQNDNIYTPHNLIAGGAKIGFAISTPRNSTPKPVGVLDVDGDVNFTNGNVTIDGLNVATEGDIINYQAASGISLSNDTFTTSGTGYFEKLAVNIENTNEAIEVSGNILLQNNDIIKWRDLDGVARNILYIDSSDVLNILNNTTGDGGKIVIRNKPGANTSATFDSNGFLGIGISNPEGILDISSTSSAPIMPRMTTEQMNAIPDPVSGMLIFNTDSGKFAGYTGAWSTLH